MGMQETYRQAFQDKLEAQIREWGAKIAVLKARAERAEADVRVEYGREVEAVTVKYDAAQAKLGKLKAAGEDAWESLRAGAEQAWNDFKAAAEAAAARFK